MIILFRPLLGFVAAMAMTSSALAQSTPVQITSGDSRDLDPIVSPDGNYLAFSSNRTGSFNIYVLRFGQPAVAQITQSKKDDRYPNWSADSRKLIFSSKRTGNSDLYETARDGSTGFYQLTDADQMEECPSYAPRGGVLFAVGSGKLLSLRPRMKVHVADSVTRVGKGRPIADGEEPSYAPDGKKIVFVSRRTGNNDIWVMNADGTYQTQLTTDSKDDENPRFSPDGKRIIFASKRTGNFDLWTMNADGSSPRQLTFDPADEFQPCWSTGGYIYYVMKRGEGISNIYRIKAPYP